MKARDTGRPRNVQAILDYCESKRPDCTESILHVLAMKGEQANAFILLISLGFEAGREFQKDNPKIPLGGGAHYLPKDLRPAEFA